MHTPTTFFDKVIPCGLTISKRNDFPNAQVLRDEAAKCYPRIPVQRDKPWYAAHFDALGHPEVTDLFTAWVNHTLLSGVGRNFMTPQALASHMIAEVVRHYGLSTFAVEWSQTTWAIVVGGAAVEPVYPSKFIAEYDHEALAA